LEKEKGYQKGMLDRDSFLLYKEDFEKERRWNAFIRKKVF